MLLHVACVYSYMCLFVYVHCISTQPFQLYFLRRIFFNVTKGGLDLALQKEKSGQEL